MPLVRLVVDCFELDRGELRLVVSLRVLLGLHLAWVGSRLMHVATAGV